MTLTQNNLKEAIEKCLLNAQGLIDDATLLKENKRKERAYTLFQLAIEEIGKVFRIYAFFIFEDITDKKAVKKFLSDFRNHKEKTRRSIAIDYYVLLVTKDIVEDKLQFLEASAHEMENIDALNDLKNYSLYTSIHSNTFKTPNEIITDKLLSGIEFRALTRCGVAKSFMKFSLPFIDDLKKYCIENPINLTDEELIANFWKDLN
ncbi:MAG: AbiV family abortive infection protein [Chitinophagaceae bacterium]|nr:AbiV family abortive infection protein [Chitinophagaceae bacterium]